MNISQSRVATSLLASILLPALILSCALPAERADSCHFLPNHIRASGPAKTIDEVETESRKHVSENPNVPQVPFGLANSEWIQLRKKLRTTDQIFQASSNAGWNGYVAMRGKCVVGYQIVSVT